MTRDLRRSAGGAAASAGFTFQHRIGAWAAVHILSEESASNPFDIPETSTLEKLSCEARGAVDDIVIGFSHGGYIGIQAKRSLSLSARPKSELAKAFSQFIRQYYDHREMIVPGREIDRLKVRFILAVGANTAATISASLRNVLERLKTLPHGNPIEEAANNAAEARALKVMGGLVRRLWRTIRGAPPEEKDVREFLSIIRLAVLDVEPGQREETRAKDLLRRGVLSNGTQAGTAWAELLSLSAELTGLRGTADRTAIQNRLRRVGITLRVLPSYEEASERLRNTSHEGRAQPTKPITIEDSYEPQYNTLNGALLLIRFIVIARGASPVHPLRGTAQIMISDTSIMAPKFFAKASKKVELADAQESLECSITCTVPLVGTTRTPAIVTLRIVPDGNSGYELPNGFYDKRYELRDSLGGRYFAEQIAKLNWL